MNVSMEFEVVFSTEEFLADLTLEFSPTPMCREVSSQVPLTGEYLRWGQEIAKNKVIRRERRPCILWMEDTHFRKVAYC